MKMAPDKAVSPFANMRLVVDGDAVATKELQASEQQLLARHVEGFKKACEQRRAYTGWKEEIPGYAHAVFLDQCGQAIVKEIFAARAEAQQALIFGRSQAAISGAFAPAFLNALADRLEQESRLVTGDLFGNAKGAVSMGLFRTLYPFAHREFHEGKKREDGAVIVAAERVCGILENAPPALVKVSKVEVRGEGTVSQVSLVSVVYDPGKEFGRMTVGLKRPFLD